MKFKSLTLILISSLFSCDTKTQKSMSELPKAPFAKQIPKKLTIHDDVRVDEFYWLNDRENPEVIDYLNKENDYYNAHTVKTKDFQVSLFDEMKSRIKEDDSSVPYKYNGYWYITKFEKGKDYPIYTRKKETLEAVEELLFDCNEMAKGHSYFRLVGLNISPNNKMSSYAVDTTGRRQYKLHIKDLKTNQIYKEEISNTTGSSTWANDNKTLFYTLKDETTLRAEAIYKHILNTDPKLDKLIYEELDDTFGVSVYKTKSKKYLVIASYSTLTSEYQILNANTPNRDFKVFQPRVRGLEYGISHFEDSFYVVSNADGAQNFKLSKTSELKTEKKYWKDVIPHREAVLLENIEIFKDYLVINERENGLNNLRIMSWDGKEDYFLPFETETYTTYIGNNPDFDSDVLRYGFNSLTSPSSVIDYNFYTKMSEVKKEQEVLGDDFNKDNYESKRIWTTARDGVKVPISLVYKKGIILNGENPLLLYAYGSYGSTTDPSFSSIRLSLLNRGFIYAIAHVRGGEYLGRQWYENGKLLSKLNTFHDFIDCSKYLIEKEITLFHAKIVNQMIKLQPKFELDIIGFHGQTIFHNADEKISVQLGNGKLLSQLTKKKVVYNFRQNDLENGGQGAPLTPIFHQNF